MLRALVLVAVEHNSVLATARSLPPRWASAADSVSTTWPRHGRLSGMPGIYLRDRESYIATTGEAYESESVLQALIAQHYSLAKILANRS
jgi:hypothetical protein